MNEPRPRETVSNTLRYSDLESGTLSRAVMTYIQWLQTDPMHDRLEMYRAAQLLDRLSK